MIVMRRLRRKLKRPKEPWYAPRIEDEKKILSKYGLRRKKEIWRAQEILRNFRRRARELNAVANEKEEKILIDKLSRLGVLPEKADLDDVLALDVYSILDRRLQSVVCRKKMAETPLQARQIIVHGKVLVNGVRVKFPSYIVPVEEERSIHVKAGGKS